MPRRSVFAVLLLAFVTAGCLTTRDVAPGAESRSAFNNEAAGRTGMIDLQSGERLTAERLHLQGDSLRWIDPASGRAEAMHECDVASVTTLNHVRGGGEGFFIGLAAGAVVGAVAMLAVAAECGECLVGPGAFALYGAGVGALVGAPVMGAFGAAAGHRTRHAFPTCGP